MIVAGLDFETSGKLDPNHRIIESCVQLWDFDPTFASPPRLIETVTQRINPERSIDAQAFAVHHISIEDLAGKPNFNSYAPMLMDLLLKADLVVAHNGHSFDRPYLEMELKRVEYPLTTFQKQAWFDTMLEGRWATTWGKVPTLRELSFACGVDYDPDKAHAAEYDVERMMQCLFFGVQNNLFDLSSD